MADEGNRAEELAISVSDGVDVDWDEAESSAESRQKRTWIRNLRLISDVARCFRGLPDPSPSISPSIPQTASRLPDLTARDDAIGEWGHLRLLEKIGEGAFGEVYRAWEPRLDREVALKLLGARIGKKDAVASSILEEGRLMAQVRHPNVATVYGAETHDDRVGLWMELIHGCTLADLLREQGAFSAREAALIGLEICGALAAVHGAGLVHGDVKAQNVMREEGGRIVLMDFNAGQEISARAGAWAGMVGTPLYMAPETLKGGEATVRSDIYSMGVLLYHLVSGEFPVRAGTQTELREAHNRREVRLLRDIRPALPEEFLRIVERALSWEPENRFRSAGTMQIALSKFLSAEGEQIPHEDGGAAAEPDRGTGGSLELEPESRDGRPVEVVPARRWVRRSMAFTGVLALLLVAAVGLWVMRGRSPAPSLPQLSADTIAVFPFAVRGEAPMEGLGEGMMDLLTAKLNGAGQLRTVDKRALMSFWKRHGGDPADPERAREAAVRFHAGLYVLGDFLAIGEGVHITASLYEAGQEGEAVARAEVEGTLDGLIGLASDLSVRLIRNLPHSAGAGFTPVAWTTSSLEALKSWLECERRLREGESGGVAGSDLVATCRRAVEADPEFALGWYSLNIAATWNREPNLALEAAERAMESSEDLPARERSLIRAAVARRQHRLDEARRLYRAHLNTYPEDVEAWIELGAVVLDSGSGGCITLDEWTQENDEVLKVWGRALELEPGNWRVETIRRQMLLDLERYEELEAATGPWDGDCADHGNFVLQDMNVNWPAYIAFRVGDAEAQRECIPALQRERDLWLAAFFIMTVQWLNFPGPEIITEELTAASRPPEVQAWGHLQMAHLAATHGRWDEAKTEFAVAEEHLPELAIEQRGLLAATAFYPIPESDIAAIRDEILDWDADAAPPMSPGTMGPILTVHNDIHAHLRLYLLAMLDMRLGDEAAAYEAIAELEDLQSPPVAGSLPSNLVATARAELAFRRGDSEEALTELGLIRRDSGAMWTPASSFGRLDYMTLLRGKVLEALDRHEEALIYYDCLEYFGSLYSHVYQPAAHLRRARIYERLGHRERARGLYTRFTALWESPDPEFAPLLEEVQVALDRLR